MSTNPSRAPICAHVRTQTWVEVTRRRRITTGRQGKTLVT
jgi:hypothetical protein